MDTHMDAPTARPWTTTAPTVAGLYQFASEETDGAWDVVHVDSWLALRRRQGAVWIGDPMGVRAGLYVDCPDLGVLPVRDYHDGLTSPRWRRVDPLIDAEDSGTDQIRDFPGIGKNHLRDSLACTR